MIELGVCPRCGDGLFEPPCAGCGWTGEDAPAPKVDRVLMTRMAFAAWCSVEWNRHPHAKRSGIAPPFMTALGSINTFIRELEVRCSRAEADSDNPGHTEVARLEMRRKSQRAVYSAHTRARLAENPQLEHVLRKYGVDGVYVFAELNANEVDVIWLEHHTGLGPDDIAAYSGRPQRIVDHLLARAQWKLRRLASVAIEQAAAG